MRRIILLIPFSIFFFCTAMSQGFTVSGTQLIDANGKNFVIRGISVPLAWFVNDVNNNIATIRKNTNANCLRIVITTSTGDASWQKCVTSCIANNMIPMVELHDVTCSTTSDDLARMANWWVKKKAFLSRPDIAKYILINIANEWGDWNMAKSSASSWKAAYLNAVSIMRKGGITTTLVIDAPNCGQDLNVGGTIKAYAKDVFNADSLKNCLFSIHMYGEWCPNGGSSPSKIATVKDAGIPIIVGEFADQSDQGNLDELTLMKTCVENGIGYMAWSLKGNNDPVIDMSYDWTATSLAPWGNTAINTENGLKNTSKRASVFAGDSGCAPTVIIPYLQINEDDLNQVSKADLDAGDSVVLAPQPTSGGSWIWYGPDGFTAETREITLKNIQTYQAGYYNVTYINPDSCISDTTFKISVKSCDAIDTTLVSGATYKILSKFTGKSLDVENSSTEDGALVKMMPPVDSAENQEWIISDIGSGNWKILSVNSMKALNIAEGSIYGGASVEQMKDTGALTMKWKITKDENGYFQIRNYRSYLCLDIKGISSDDGAEVIQGTCISDNNQKFSLLKLKDPEPNSVENTNTNKISIYPNPAHGGKISISIDNNSDGSYIQIVDLQGKILYSAYLNKNITEINTGLTSGQYIVNINNKYINYNQKLIIH